MTPLVLIRRSVSKTGQQCKRKRPSKSPALGAHQPQWWKSFSTREQTILSAEPHFHLDCLDRGDAGRVLEAPVCRIDESKDWKWTREGKQGFTQILAKLND